ncbi:HIRAN domain-containing protein [Pseudoleptotrichia goodfellowii]|uniref:HIRAN domain protein n=2 Tax=Pseudoleptotrichia goodfellowii TaxID=157692 RepID=D0GIT2_9FUSO|nr:HIRAN domain-containing protein [Pseudoleptotrichia goodfellowii]EEY35994.1 HIRAN domain protein [Pseudoleptotrichia goodfellowii F0264]MBF4806672.1 hypothetical protein [Pseudoleptotrichia goodfellowii]BBM36201.1 hypothetical protein JCM16774_1133 [Pseudoleptotrichia goodfellowii]
MLSNTFSGIKLEFEGLYYGGNYDIEIFSDGRFYYSYIENDAVEIKKGSFQITQKEVMIFEEMMDYFEFLKNQRNYMINEYQFGNGILVIQKKNGREEKIRLGKEMMFEYSKILIDKYIPKSKRIFLLDTYLSGTKYIRNFGLKIKDAHILDLYREFNGVSLNAVAAFNANKEKVGYVPKEQNEIIARLIDAGKKIVAIPIPFDDEVALKIYMSD